GDPDCDDRIQVEGVQRESVAVGQGANRLELGQVLGAVCRWGLHGAHVNCLHSSGVGSRMPSGPFISSQLSGTPTMCMPPSTVKVTPVIQPAASDARKTTTFAMSSV